MKSRKVLILVLSTIMFLVAACGPTKGATDSNNSTIGQEMPTLKLYTSFYPMYYFTKTIVGDTAEVENILPAGADSHDYEPNISIITKLLDADALIYQGAGMEFWLDKVQATVQAEKSDLRFIEAAEGIELLVPGETHEEHDADDNEHDAHDHDAHDGHDHTYDPHVWLSIRDSMTMLENIHHELVALNPEAQEAYDTNLKSALDQLKTLDKKFKKELDHAGLKYFIINHEAFGYLARDYDLQQVGISGVGTEQDPNPALMKEIVQFAKEQEIDVIYYDSSGSSKVSEALAREIGGRVLPLTTIHAPSDEDLAKGVDYIDFMEDNLRNLLESTK